MAKIKVAFGQMRGKIGGVVYRHDPSGYTVASEYNPQPANPRTAMQTAQRNKMNLAGRLSSFTPYLAIAGLDSNKRKARSMFVKNILNLAGTSSSGTGSNTAAIERSAIKLSNGSPALLSVTPTYDVSNHVLTVSVANADAARDVMFVRVMAYFVKGENIVFSACKDSQPMTGTTARDVTFDLSGIFTGSNGIAEIYVIPVVGDNALARTTYDNLIADDNDDESYKIQVTRSLVALGAFGASQYVGQTLLPRQ